MAYLDTYNLRQDPVLRSRVVGCVWANYQAIEAEDAGTTNHTNRLAYARRAVISAADEGIHSLMFYAICANATIAANGSSSTDAQILTAVGAALNNVANAAVAMGLT